MAIRPELQDYKGNPIDTYNYIRSGLSTNLQDILPLAGVDNCQTIGQILLERSNVRNEFFGAFYNRIALVVQTSKMWSNPLAFVRKGIFQLGDTIEETFTDLIKPYKYDPAVDQNKFWKRELANIRSAFHVMNCQVYYPCTFNRNLVAKAFVSWDGVDQLFNNLMTAIYKSEAFDDFNMIKYLLAKRILTGRAYTEKIDAVNATNIAGIITKIKTASGNMQFPSTTYNPIGVLNEADRQNQYLFSTVKLNAVSDVNLLASAFNMEKAEFLGHRVEVDSFANIDMDRIKLMYTDADGNLCDGITDFTADELTSLSKIQAVLVDGDFFQCYDNLREFTEFRNGRSLEDTVFQHVWRTYSTSPFANICVFTEEAGSVTKVELNSNAETVAAGAETDIELTATVTVVGPTSQAVRWTTSDNTKATVDATGKVHVYEMADAATVTITATSVADNTKYDACVITADAGE